MANQEGGQIVRVLFGNMTTHPKLRGEVISSLAAAWSRNECLHMVAGIENAKILTSNGAKRVQLIDDADHIEESAYGRWYSKPLLLRRAMDAYPEVLFLDFDCAVLRQPDLRMWQILRAKQGPLGGSFLSPNVAYRRPQCFCPPRRPGVHPIRRCLQSSAVYCADTSWLDAWLDAFRLLRERGFNMLGVNDERALIYALDLRVGILSSQEMVDCFENPIVRVRRNIPEALPKIQDSLYFRHR